MSKWQMNYAAIKAKLATAPYSGMAQDGSADAAILAAIFAETVDDWLDVDAGTIAGIAELTPWNAADATQGYIFEHLEGLAAVTGDATPQIVARKLLRMLTRGSAATNFQMSDATKRGAILAMLDALVAGSGMGAEAEAALLAPAKRARPWPDANDCSGAQVEHIAIARAS